MLNDAFTPLTYATQWFLTLCSVSFSFEVVVRIWDSFIVEGIKIIYRVAIAIMKDN